MSNMIWKFEVYQLPYEIHKRLMDEQRLTPFMYSGEESSEKPYAFTREVARGLFERNGYQPVARFNVDTLEGVFRASNHGDEEVISRWSDTSMHSVSVGDIVRNRETDDYWIVAPMGFDPMGRMRRVI